MNCLKCGRKFSDNKKICIYCGASLDGQASPQTNYFVTKDSNIFLSEEQNNSGKLQNPSKHVRHKIEDDFLNGNDGAIVSEERTIVQPHIKNTNEQRGAISLEKILALLSKMKDSFNSGHLENSVYERMVLDIMKDFISTLDDDIKLNFVVNQIMDSELADYLDEERLNKLRAFVISSLTDKKTV